MLPIDIDRLQSQTAGDLVLQREVLGLFVDAIPDQLARLKAGNETERRAVAHQIVGSARALGAMDVAREAAAIEAGAGDLALLEAALGAARTYIQATLLR